MTAPTRPALRYHGGKFRLAPWLLQLFPPHQAYLEPFCGAASMLLAKPRAPAECLNDRDDRIVEFFRVLRDPAQAADLRHRVSMTPYARAELEWSFEPGRDPVDRAHRLVVRSFMGHGSDSATRLTRTGFRSRLTDGRALPSAEWSRWHEAVDDFTARLRGVVLENDDFEGCIRRMDSPTTLIYCDPPYVHSTRSAKRANSSTTNGYRFEMTDADHTRLGRQLLACSSMVLVSGYHSPMYDGLFAKWARFERQVVADTAKFRTEVVWLNDRASAALNLARGGLFAGQEAAA